MPRAARGFAGQLNHVGMIDAVNARRTGPQRREAEDADPAAQVSHHVSRFHRGRDGALVKRLPPLEREIFKMFVEDRGHLDWDTTVIWPLANAVRDRVAQVRLIHCPGLLQPPLPRIGTDYSPKCKRRALRTRRKQ